MHTRVSTRHPSDILGSRRDPVDVVEAILSLGAGYQAHSLALTGFGMDSLIELVSASILVWRLRIEARGADDHAVDRAEVKAARWAVGLLGLLLLYLIGGALWALTTPSTVRPSPVGIIVMIISGVLMVLFARQKRRLGVALQSSALQADAAESWTWCVHGLGGIRRHTGCMGLRVDMDGPCRRSRHCLLGGPRMGSIRRSAGNRGPGTSIGRIWAPSIDSAEIVR